MKKLISFILILTFIVTISAFSKEKSKKELKKDLKQAEENYRAMVISYDDLNLKYNELLNSINKTSVEEVKVKRDYADYDISDFNVVSFNVVGKTYFVTLASKDFRFVIKCSVDKNGKLKPLFLLEHKENGLVNIEKIK